MCICVASVGRRFSQSRAMACSSRQAAIVGQILTNSFSESLDRVRQEISVYRIKLFELAVLAVAGVQ